MTLDYKILGQLYYGPEINETPEIPGTAGYYTSSTGSITPTFVATGFSTSEISYSTDGINWVSKNIPIFENWRQVAYGNGKFVITADNGVGLAAYSSDGITWSVTSFPSLQVYSVHYIAGKFFAYSGSTAIYSTDGITWQTQELPIALGYTLNIAEGNGMLVSVGSPSRYSTDGINWTQINLPDRTWWSIAYGNGQFVAYAPPYSQNQQYFNPMLAYSADGIVWTTQSSVSIPEIFRIAYGDGKFIATTAGTSSAAFYSVDGLSWTQTSLPVSQYWRSLTYGNGKFVAVGYTKSAAYSLDGITWVESLLAGGPSTTYNSVVYAEVNTLVEVQISIGSQGTPGAYVEITEPQVLYTVPSGTETTVTSIYVTNHDSVQRTYDLAVVPAGETLSLKHHIRWDMPVASSDFDLANAKLTLSAGDKIYVFPSTVNKVGFTAFGVEKS